MCRGRCYCDYSFIAGCSVITYVATENEAKNEYDLRTKVGLAAGRQLALRLSEVYIYL